MCVCVYIYIYIYIKIALVSECFDQTVVSQQSGFTHETHHVDHGTPTDGGGTGLRQVVHLEDQPHARRQADALTVRQTQYLGKKEGNVLFNDTLNTFYLRRYSIRHNMTKDHSDSERGNHMGYSFRLTARVLLYAPSHRQDSTYQGLCYTSRGATGWNEK